MAQTYHHPEIVRDWRKQAGLSQEALATDVGVKRQHINRLEAGRGASLVVLGKIAKRLKKPLRDALTNEGKQRLEKLTSLLD